ncbi:MAG: metallophosphoesterase family protein [Aeromicrobium sp.]
MVKVLAVADEVVPSLYDVGVRDLGAELVLAAGDLPWDYLEFLSSCLNVPVVFVPGNHDPEISSARQSRSGLYFEDGRPSDAPRPRGAINADQAIVDVVGLRIAGLGGCVRYNAGTNQYTQRQYGRRARRLMQRARRAPGEGVDVLLTHAPPRGLGDQEDPCHVGIEALHGVLESLQPTWHLHGHIHPYGEKRPDRGVGPTTIRNVVPYRLLDVVASVPGRQSEEVRRGS